MADNINQTIEDLRQAILLAVEKEGQCCQPKGSKTGAEPSTQEPVYGGIDDEYPDSQAFFDARCSSSNAVYDTILGTVVWLDDNHVDLKAGLFGGLTSGLIFGLMFAGPAGWALIVSGALVTSLITWIIKESLDFDALTTSLDDVHEELVAALYNGATIPGMRSNFLTILAGATPTPSSELLFLVRILLGEDLLNQVLEPRSDLAKYQSDDPVDCGGTIVVWDFDSDTESWTFRDDSTANASAVGSYDGTNEALSHAQIIVAGGSHRLTAAVDVSPVLSQVVLPGNSIQADHDSTSDGVVVSRTLKAVYTDDTEISYYKGAHAGEGTIILDIVTGGTIKLVELETARSNGSSTTGYSFTTKTLEVRIQ